MLYLYFDNFEELGARQVYTCLDNETELVFSGLQKQRLNNLM